MRVHHKIHCFVSTLGDCFVVNGHVCGLPFSMATMSHADSAQITRESIVGRIVERLALRNAFLSPSLVRELSFLAGVYLNRFQCKPDAARLAIVERTYLISGKVA